MKSMKTVMKNDEITAPAAPASPPRIDPSDWCVFARLITPSLIVCSAPTRLSGATRPGS